ncbi:conserved hypothetical protein [Tenacibaculum litoreum]|uniref:hypothetical protein n=1 Tax=Tenacibaculum litoreum TaxID=321269 RepID=UPI0038947587
MEPATWGFIGTIVGTIVGALASIYTTYLNGKNTASIQNKSETFKREELFREFQRDNYLKLQEIIPKIIRLINLLLLEDKENYQKTREWQKASVNSENDNNLMNQLRELSIYTERVDNTDLREELKKIKTKAGKVLMTSSWSESDLIMSDLIKNDYDRIMENLGIELRKNYKN